MTKRNGKNSNGKNPFELTDRLARQGLVISVTMESDFALYYLEYDSKKRLEGIERSKPPVPSLCIGYKNSRSGEVETLHSFYFEQVAEWLTGMTLEQLAAYAPIYVVINRPERLVWEWKPHPAEISR